MYLCIVYVYMYVYYAMLLIKVTLFLDTNTPLKCLAICYPVILLTLTASTQLRRVCENRITLTLFCFFCQCIHQILSTVFPQYSHFVENCSPNRYNDVAFMYLRIMHVTLILLDMYLICTGSMLSISHFPHLYVSHNMFVCSNMHVAITVIV